jgi:peroxiredoxin
MHTALTAAARAIAAAAVLAAASLAASASGLERLGPDWTPPVFQPTDAVPTSAESAAARAMRAGKQAPMVTFTDTGGKKVSLQSLIAEQPIVLIFYRGGWCPYCVKQLKEFEEQRESTSRRAGGRIVAVSTELHEFTPRRPARRTSSTSRAQRPRREVVPRFGVAWANARYGPGLAKYQGNDKGEIPLGVTYVIDSRRHHPLGLPRGRLQEAGDPGQQAIEALNEID